MEETFNKKRNSGKVNLTKRKIQYGNDNRRDYFYSNCLGMRNLTNYILLLQSTEIREKINKKIK